MGNCPGGCGESSSSTHYNVVGKAKAMPINLDSTRFILKDYRDNTIGEFENSTDALRAQAKAPASTIYPVEN